MIAFDLERTSTDPGTYPIVLVSYMAACTGGDNADRRACGCSAYAISSEGQQAAAKNAGSAPLTDEDDASRSSRGGRDRRLSQDAHRQAGRG